MGLGSTHRHESLRIWNGTNHLDGAQIHILILLPYPLTNRRYRGGHSQTPALWDALTLICNKEAGRETNHTNKPGEIQKQWVREKK